MVFIPGSNNGESGLNMYRALFPSNMGGFGGKNGLPLPNAFANSSPTISNSRNYGKSIKRKKKSRKSRKSRKSKKCKKH